jgi:protocatechuate 3,4-dioxygenase beta subunit
VFVDQRCADDGMSGTMMSGEPSMSTTITRRTWLSLTGLGVPGLVLGCKPVDDTSDVDGHGDTDANTHADTDTGADTDTDVTDDCEPTRPDMQGPYWREGVPVRSELDLYGEDATGLVVTGRVLDESCRPLRNAIVAIWHCDSAGNYDWEETSPEMRYYGQTATDADGRWRFHTIMPGIYADRPVRHVHVKVWADGPEPLTTQIYFEGESEGATSQDLVAPVTDLGNGELQIDFDIVV